MERAKSTIILHRCMLWCTRCKKMISYKQMHKYTYLSINYFLLSMLDPLSKNLERLDCILFKHLQMVTYTYSFDRRSFDFWVYHIYVRYAKNILDNTCILMCIRAPGSSMDLTFFAFERLSYANLGGGRKVFLRWCKPNSREGRVLVTFYLCILWCI